MVAAVGDPPYGVAVGARVLGLDVRSAARLGLGGVLGLAPVEAEELVAQRAAGVDGQDGVDDAVDSQVGDGRVAAVAAAELGAGDGGNGAEDVCSMVRRYFSFLSPFTFFFSLWCGDIGWNSKGEETHRVASRPQSTTWHLQN